MIMSDEEVAIASPGLSHLERDAAKHNVAAKNLVPARRGASSVTLNGKRYEILEQGVKDRI
jgi:hypothetical protein